VEKIVFAPTDYQSLDTETAGYAPLLVGMDGFWLPFGKIRKIDWGVEGQVEVTFADGETLSGKLVGVQALEGPDKKQIPIGDIATIEFEVKEKPKQ